jgi:hypothetical protein
LTQNTAEIIYDFIIAKSEDFPTVQCEQLGSCRVFLGAVQMDVAIDFNNEFLRRARKVDDERTEWMLPSKRQTL